MLKSKPQPEKTLSERIKEMPEGELLDVAVQLQAEINSRIDARVEELRPVFKFNLPPSMLRRDIENRATGCECKQFKAMVESK